jgi:hypothetical protein
MVIPTDEDHFEYASYYEDTDSEANTYEDIHNQWV